jgi:hypothetical protein
MDWAEHAARMGEMVNASILAVGKPEGKKSLKKYDHRWKDSIKMDLKEIGWKGVD